MPSKKKRCHRTIQKLNRERQHRKRNDENNAERVKRLKSQRVLMSGARIQEIPEERAIRLKRARILSSARRIQETSEEKEKRLEHNRVLTATARAQEMPEEREKRRKRIRTSMSIARWRVWRDKENAAFNYSAEIDYSSDPSLCIGSMTFPCHSCAALKWKDETRGMCCSVGKIKLPPLPDPPEMLHSLLVDDSYVAKHFQQNIRRYNACFAMTSFGATKKIREPGYMPTFKIQGQVYHRIGGLNPAENEDPKYLQLYFVNDFQQQLKQRCKNDSIVREDLILSLQEMLHKENNYVKSFKMAMEIITTELSLKITADRIPNIEHEGRFNIPVSSEVAVIMTGERCESRDIVLNLRDNTLRRISETHRSYDALQYPLLFWKGEDGYHFELKQINSDTGSLSSKKISAMNFYAFRIMVRPEEFNIILRGRELFHQFLVDVYAKIETERLRYIQLNQRKLRAADYIDLRDAVINDGNIHNIGHLVILPSTFTGSPRYMHERTQDAMTYVRTYGRPDLFITFTCNPNWEEIRRELFPGQKPQDRHDLLARVFHLKQKLMMHLISKAKIFGAVQCFMYTVEWQKRGLPHSHILVWLKEKIHAQRTDEFISSEIPNPEEDPQLFNCIRTHMVHGPCGLINPNSPCMKNGVCSKRYPRKFLKQTQTGVDGYPLYRRRSPEDGGFTTNLFIRGSEISVDNRWIVPHCPLLSRLFNAHINVEFCNSVKSIKYVCKYINKGSDMASFQITDTQNEHNEVIQYQIGRYISSNEAAWRILNFPIHERYPNVMHLSVHLENGQRIYFTSNNAVERAEVPQETTLTAFFRLCREDDFACSLLYNEIPKYYTWNSREKKWNRRKVGTDVPNHPDIKCCDALGRVYTIHPSNSECYHLRLLLHVVRGPQSFKDLKTIDGDVCETFKMACHLRGLLENDNHWHATLEEAALSKSPAMLRNLFAIMLKTCHLSNPLELWMKHKENFSEDILHQTRILHNDMEMEYSDIIFNTVLVIIEDKLISLGGLELKSFGLPQPNRSGESDTVTNLYSEMSYDIQELLIYLQENESKMTSDQKEVFNIITEAVCKQSGGIFFLDAPGGTGKTFLLNLILAKIRHRKHIALSVASSGIAATLLAGGKTAHSAFKLPLNLATLERPTCNISRGSDKAKLLLKCRLIVWDEFTMSHKAAFEALNITLQDIKNNTNIMGGITLLLSGDFRQTLPVIPRGTKADEINACLKSSYLWKHVRRFSLKTNMRAFLTGNIHARDFSEKLLEIGNGSLCNNDGFVKLDTIAHEVKTHDELIMTVFPNLEENYRDHNWLCERAILCPKNDDVRVTNNELLDRLPGTIRSYKSIDTVLEENETVNYPTEFLNSLEISGIPSHTLHLKTGTPIMLLRNLDPPNLCNGTRLSVKKLSNNIIEATILTGPASGKDVFIPRIPVIPSDLSFQFKRLQFPVSLSFAITINKAQGQSLKCVGVDLRNPCFSHGQLYVACSRVGSKENLHILTKNDMTVNIVYPEALQD